MKVLLIISGVGIILLSLIICLSAEDEAWPWYSRVSRVGRDLMGLTSSTSPIAIALNNLIGQKNPFTAFDIFLNQTRRIIPTVATFGNFTLLQAALVCAVGAIAAGAATIAAEAFYFKTMNDQEHQMGHYHDHYVAQLPSIAYGNQNHFRREYDEGPKVAGGGKSLRPSPYSDPTRKYSPYSELQKRYPTKSLKRTQRRNQRKNKNTGDQLQKLFPTM